MSHGGQPMPMPGGMTMKFQFAEGGVLTMSMSGGPQGAGADRQGTYSVDGGKITMSMQNETKSGTIAFEGPDRVILDFTEAKMTLTRS
jgi:hypothetical protein